MGKMKWLLFFVIFLVCEVSWSLVYQWEDEYGNIVISNLTPENNVKYRVVDVEKAAIKFKSVWDVKNKATEELEKMLRKIEEEREKQKKLAEKEGEKKEEKKEQKKKGWIPLVGKSQNSSGEIVVTVTEVNPKIYGNLPYDIFKVKIENLGGIEVRFSRVFTKIILKNDAGIEHSYVPRKVAIKKDLTFADQIPEDETLGPAEKKSYIIAFSPVKDPTVMVFDKFVNVEDGYVEVDLIRKEVKEEKEEKKSKPATEEAKVPPLAGLDKLQGENIFAVPAGGKISPKTPVPPLPKAPLPPAAQVPSKKQELPADPMLGLRVRPVDSSLQRKLNLRSKKGLYIKEVLVDSAAYNGGLKKGDIIETVNNQDVNTEDDLKKIIDNASRGEAINFFVNRNNTWENFTVIKR